MLKTVDLFAGCGGLSLGFQTAGADIRAAFEFWPIAADCYERNFNHPVFRTDLSDTKNAIKQIRPFAPELIIGGPPCQDFSHAGKRVEANRAGLTGSFAEIVSEIKPKYFVMENVDRAEKSNAYAHAREILKKAGYGLTELVLDASHCGVPQKRKRFFCIGVLGGPDNAVRKELLNGMTKEATTLRAYFGEQLDFEFYYRHPRNYSRRAIFSIDEPAPTMRGMNRPVPKGYPGHPNDACPLSQDIRALTTEERAMIQTFPANYMWTGSKTDVEQMIGNAVPVKLAEYVAGALFRYIGSTTDSQVAVEDFKNWLIGEKNYSEKSAKDIISRCKRAERIVGHIGIPDAYYIFTLEHQLEFQGLSAPVKSQIKRALALNEQFARMQNVLI
jgi:DNA (cytosine-5)-methyltransferase 1